MFYFYINLLRLKVIDKNFNYFGCKSLQFDDSATFCDFKHYLALIVFTIRHKDITVFYATKTDFFMQHISENFAFSTIPERGTFLIVISCGNFNIAQDRNTLLGSEILSPLNRRLQCERVRMRLIRDKKIIFASKPTYFVY